MSKTNALHRAKRPLAMLLAVLMVLTLLPTVALADEPGTETGTNYVLGTNNPEGITQVGQTDEFSIASSATATISDGATLEIPGDKTLTVEGTLALGSMDNIAPSSSGTIVFKGASAKATVDGVTLIGSEGELLGTDGGTTLAKLGANGTIAVTKTIGDGLNFTVSSVGTVGTSGYSASHPTPDVTIAEAALAMFGENDKLTLQAPVVARIGENSFELTSGSIEASLAGIKITNASGTYYEGNRHNSVVNTFSLNDLSATCIFTDKMEVENLAITSGTLSVALSDGESLEIATGVALAGSSGTLTIGNSDNGAATAYYAELSGFGGAINYAASGNAKNGSIPVVSFTDATFRVNMTRKANDGVTTTARFVVNGAELKAGTMDITTLMTQQGAAQLLLAAIVDPDSDPNNVSLTVSGSGAFKYTASDYVVGQSANSENSFFVLGGASGDSVNAKLINLTSGALAFTTKGNVSIGGLGKVSDSDTSSDLHAIDKYNTLTVETGTLTVPNGSELFIKGELTVKDGADIEVSGNGKIQVGTSDASAYTDATAALEAGAELIVSGETAQIDVYKVLLFEDTSKITFGSTTGGKVVLQSGASVGCVGTEEKGTIGSTFTQLKNGVNETTAAATTALTVQSGATAGVSGQTLTVAAGTYTVKTNTTNKQIIFTKDGGGDPTDPGTPTAAEFKTALESHVKAAVGATGKNAYGIPASGTLNNMHLWHDTASNKTYVYYVGGTSPDAPEIAGVTGSGDSGTYSYTISGGSSGTATYTVIFQAVALYNVVFDDGVTGTINITDGTDTGIDAAESKYIIGFTGSNTAITIKSGNITVAVKDASENTVTPTGDKYTVTSQVYEVKVSAKTGEPTPTPSAVTMTSDINLSNQTIWPSGTWGDMAAILSGKAAPAYAVDGTDATKWNATGTLTKVTGWTQFNSSVEAEQSGYYAGIFIPVPAGVNASGFKGKLGTKDLSASAIEGGEGKKGLYFIIWVAGADATSVTKTLTIEIDWDGEGTTYTKTAITVDFSGVTLDDGTTEPVYTSIVNDTGVQAYYHLTDSMPTIESTLDSGTISLTFPSTMPESSLGAVAINLGTDVLGSDLTSTTFKLSYTDTSQTDPANIPVYWTTDGNNWGLINQAAATSGGHGSFSACILPSGYTVGGSTNIGGWLVVFFNKNDSDTMLYFDGADNSKTKVLVDLSAVTYVEPTDPAPTVSTVSAPAMDGANLTGGTGSNIGRYTVEKAASFGSGTQAAPYAITMTGTGPLTDVTSAVEPQGTGKWVGAVIQLNGVTDITGYKYSTNGSDWHSFVSDDVEDAKNATGNQETKGAFVYWFKATDASETTKTIQVRKGENGTPAYIQLTFTPYSPKTITLAIDGTAAAKAIAVPSAVENIKTNDPDKNGLYHVDGHADVISAVKTAGGVGITWNHSESEGLFKQTYNNTRVNVTVTSGNAENAYLLAHNDADTYELIKTGFMGEKLGQPIANFSSVSTLTFFATAAGDYSIKLDLVDVSNNNAVLATGTLNINVGSATGQESNEALVTGIAALPDAYISAVEGTAGTITATVTSATETVNLTATVSTNAKVSYFSDALCNNSIESITAYSLGVGENIVYIRVESESGTVVNIYTVTITRETPPAAALTGTATIDNTSPKIGETLTASLEGGNNTGDLSYAWKIDGNTVGTNETYVVKAADLGKTITVEIKSSVETGTLTSTATAAVTKKDNISTAIKPVVLSQTTNSITLTPVAGYEYAKVASGTNVSEATWQASPVFSGLVSGTTYDFYQRVAETSDTSASNASEKLAVTVGKITWSAVANGSSGQVTTTMLYLTFSEAVELNTTGVTEISTHTGFTPVSLTKVNDTTYTLEISSISVANGANIAIAITKDGVESASQDIAVNVAPTEVAWSTLAANGTAGTVTTTELTLTFDKTVTMTNGDDFEIVGADFKSIKSGNGSNSIVIEIENITVVDGGIVTVSLDNDDYDFTPNTKNVVVNVAPTAVTWSNLEANGSSGSTTTTVLTLTFDKDVPLTLADITITGATKIQLATGSNANTYDLTIGSITVANDANVTVALQNPVGYTISESSKSVQIHLAEQKGFTLTLKSTPPTNIAPKQIVTFEYEIETTVDEMYSVELDLIYDTTQLTIDPSSITISPSFPSDWVNMSSGQQYGYRVSYAPSALEANPTLLSTSSKITVSVSFTAADPLAGETVTVGAIVNGMDDNLDDYYGDGVETSMGVVEKKLVLTTASVNASYSIRTVNETNVAEGKYLFGLPEKKNADFVKALFDSAYTTDCTIKVYNASGAEITSNATNVGTGCVVKLVDNADGYVWGSVTVVVKGDVTGSGTITLKDYTMVGRTYINASYLQDAYQLAARVTGKSTVQLKDYTMVGRHYVGTLDIYAQ